MEDFLDKKLKAELDPQIFLAFVEAKAVSDFHYKNVHNGYPKDSLEFETYKKTIDELTEATS